MPAKISGIVTSDDQDEAFDIAGAWRLGRCNFTCSAKLDIGPQDRITFLDMPIRTSEEITRGAGAADILPLILVQPEVVGIVDGDGTVYRAGFDFNFPTAPTERSLRSVGKAPTPHDFHSVCRSPQRATAMDHQRPTQNAELWEKPTPLRVTLIADDQRVRQ